MKQVRIQEIVDLITKEGYVSTDALASHFKVSPQTIRRDLEILDQQGIVVKMYGGATLVNNDPVKGGSDLSFFSFTPSADNLEEKSAIVKKSMDFIQDGNTIALDIGSTTRLMGQELSRKNNLVIITKDMLLATALHNHPTNRVYLLGGFIGASGCTSGEFIAEFLENVSRIDVFFMSTDGVTVNEGFTNNYAGVEAYRSLLLPLAMKRVALADHTKIGKIGFYRTCGLTDVDHIITDSKVNPNDVKEIREAGADIIVA